MTALSPEEIDALLKKQERPSPWGFALTYNWPEHGAVRVHAKEMRCTMVLVNNKECHVSTHYTVDGRIRCSLCSVKELNEMIADIRSKESVDS